MMAVRKHARVCVRVHVRVCTFSRYPLFLQDHPGKHFPESFISKLHMNICSLQGENDSSQIGFNNNLGSAKWRGLRQTMWPHTNFLPYKTLISLIRILIPSAKQCRSPEQRLCMSSVAFSLNCVLQFLWASLLMEQGMFALDGSFFYLLFQ